MRSSPSKVVRFFPIKIKQNWQQAVPKPDATREKGKWLQTKLPTQKSPYPKQPPITKRTGYLSHTGDYLTADPKRNFLICRRARRQRSQSPIWMTVRIDKH